MEHAAPFRFHAAQEATAAAVSAEPWRSNPAPRLELRATVVIPVKDEADSLPRALAALAAQTDLRGQPLSPGSYEVLVLANNCQDATAAVARRFAATHPDLVVHVAEITLPPAEAHVGKARRLLMDEAYRRLELVCPGAGLILSTDGDTCAAPDWLAATQAEMLTYRADALGGRILTLPATPGAATRSYQLRDTAYQLLRARLEALLDPDAADPWPRHHQHFGASFAITAAAYRRVGGLPVVAYLEDEALYQALCRHDLRVRHSPAVRVFTSDRHEGRVEVGLSWQLRQWAALHEQQQEPVVESPARLAALWQARRQLRELWRQTNQSSLPMLRLPSDAVQAVGAQLGIDSFDLDQRLRWAFTFGQLWHWVQQEQTRTGWLRRWPPMALTQAVRELRLLVACQEATPVAR
ncbi:glycosyltransferase [Hymenobacter persicinus]|uniref:Glycosyltransferase n=1 Tax=Hymenobacter persicinus TaxID=2025506 RepID=A0A4Q5LEC2_9BACT|nr:glycosyltransferase [Hymenobacter persicinus]RYU80781.1 glycosyltransferase [Hymenobacter persicinus]